VFFSTNCDDEAKQEVRTVLQIETEALAEKYLGPPTALGGQLKRLLSVCLIKSGA
jgi:hypothetical protein